MFTPGTLSSFRRADLIAACERMPQQARPKAFRSMSKDDLFFAVLRAANDVPDFGEEVCRMAYRIENPHRSALDWTARKLAKRAEG